MKFSTKAETLDQLRGRLKHATVLPQVRFTVGEWREAGRSLSALLPCVDDWFSEAVIVRSSALAEDAAERSLAGHFTSVLDVRGASAIEEAINSVERSFDSKSGTDQIFIQPMLRGLVGSGVAFTREPSGGGHYYVICNDCLSGSSDAVTSGRSNEIETSYVLKSAVPRDERLRPIVALLHELEEIFDNDALDVEFAITQDGTVVLLQVRPLKLNGSGYIDAGHHGEAVQGIRRRLRELSKPHPYLLGRRSIFGNMPDWNPAEAIGVRPRPLALSLYKELLTNDIWAYQRDNYGYRNLRSFPLLVGLGGLPYIDVRISFNSFIPASLDETLADRLVNHYLDRLAENPALHDKVEFDIIYSCYTLDLPERIEALEQFGFSAADRELICESLRALTNRIVHNESGLWRKDIQKIAELERRQDAINQSDLEPLERAYWLLEDCKRYGTLPFAGLARAGFIAVQLLRSMMAKDILSSAEYASFMESLNTVSSSLGSDFAVLSRREFLKKYGHLRPGTYDLMSPRYDEAPDRYFDWDKSGADAAPSKRPDFALSLEKLNRLEQMLKEHRLEHNVLTLISFIKAAIEGREYAKFVFTRSLSEVLRIMQSLGQSIGISSDDMSYADISCVKRLYSSTLDVKSVFESALAQGKKDFAITKSIVLPPVIVSEDDVVDFMMPEMEPNFITLRSASGQRVLEDVPKENLVGNILMIQSADPGYDWVFSQGIAGFITMYGGANSHMAIRAGELGIPAVIGAGEALYERWKSASHLEIDCALRQVRRIK